MFNRDEREEFENTEAATSECITNCREACKNVIGKSNSGNSKLITSALVHTPYRSAKKKLKRAPLDNTDDTLSSSEPSIEQKTITTGATGGSAACGPSAASYKLPG